MTSARIFLSHDLATVHCAEDGMYALLLAVIELARRDAAVDVEAMTGFARKQAECDRDSAIAFLEDIGLI